MAFQTFAFDFTLIDKTVYEIIKNRFTPLQVATPLTPFNTSNLSLQDFLKFISF